MRLKLWIALGLLPATLPAVRTEAAKVTPQILVDHLGYDVAGPKKVVARTTAGPLPSRFAVLDYGGRVVFQGALSAGRQVDGWKQGQFARGDFSQLRVPGRYRVRVGNGAAAVTSDAFSISAAQLPRAALSDLLAFLKVQRSSGIFDETDRHMSFFGDKRAPVDVHGGWYDASGDVSKYLTHLSYANFMNPQQTPLVVWTLVESADLLRASKDPYLSGIVARMDEEALYGADFLVRMQDPAGYFYTTVFDGWSHETGKREICSYKTQHGDKNNEYQAGFREGGGMTIAALARISLLQKGGDYPAKRYLAASEKGFAHLEANNLKYVDDHRENIIDDYAALLAGAELFAATRKPAYLDAARKRASALQGRLQHEGGVADFWRADDGHRPFFHGSDAGLPVVALLRYAQVEPDPAQQASAVAAVKRSMGFELWVTREVWNPFGYARQYVKASEGGNRTAFFIPHNNESGYWWQGEDARLASLATAALMASRSIPAMKADLVTYAVDQLDWIFGLNPFDVCFLHGKGRTNAEYLPEAPNLPGGICNGITAGFTDEHDIAFLPSPYDKDPDQNWRWSEQWIPHVAWAILALCQQATLQ